MRFSSVITSLSIYWIYGLVDANPHRLPSIHSTPHLQKLSPPLSYGEALVIDFLPGANVKIKYLYTLFLHEEPPIDCGMGEFYLQGNMTQLNELVLRQGDGFIHEITPGKRNSIEKSNCGDVEGKIVGFELRTQPDLRFRMRLSRKLFKKLYKVDREGASLKFNFFSNLLKEWLFEISFEQNMITTILRSPKTENRFYPRQERLWSSPWKTRIGGPYIRLLIARVNNRLIITLNDQCFGVFELKTRHYDVSDLAFNRIKITDNSTEWPEPWESHILSHETARLPVNDLLQYNSCWDRSESIDWENY
ncbi:unnamed protein product, partial [Mesorhabditis belari]|uniref:Galectin n=1 Tax=Mesorhabditis belari TaxID=2138241 RepID=A0AAF3FBB4_9BILA